MVILHCVENLFKILRTLLKQNTALLSILRQSVTGVTSQLFSIIWWFRAWKPYIFWKHIIQGGHPVHSYHLTSLPTDKKWYSSWQDWFPNIFGAFWLAWPGCNAILQPPALIRRPWPLTSPLTPPGTPGTLALASLPLSGTSDVEVEQNAAG